MSVGNSKNSMEILETSSGIPENETLPASVVSEDEGDIAPHQSHRTLAIHLLYEVLLSHQNMVLHR